jgi:betaine reductase
MAAERVSFAGTQGVNADVGSKEVSLMLDLKDKLVLALGERDGIPAPALRACIESAGGRVIYEVTQCFV